MLSIGNIHKAYRDGDQPLHVLCGISLDIARGQSVALMGASGSGKSTLLQIAAGLERPDQGSVTIADQHVGDLGENQLAMLRRQRLGFVFQQFNLLPGLSARDNLLFQRRLNRQADHSDWVTALIDGLQLAPFLDKRIEKLSGGQQQRVAIGRAMAHQPTLLFADEPTGNLHDELSHRVMGMLVDLVNQSQCALLLVTHARSMASYLQRRVVLKAGLLSDPQQ